MLANKEKSSAKTLMLVACEITRLSLVTVVGSKVVVQSLHVEPRDEATDVV